MSNAYSLSGPMRKISLALVLSFATAGIAFAGQESTIFKFDGKDFIRTHTTLMQESGMSAMHTKLDHSSPAYKALMAKHSYTGMTTLFHQKCDSIYSPVLDASGKMTGALFVAMCGGK